VQGGLDSAKLGKSGLFLLFAAMLQVDGGLRRKSRANSHATQTKADMECFRGEWVSDSGGKPEQMGDVRETILSEIMKIARSVAKRNWP
jgi:hypothetical protein